MVNFSDITLNNFSKYHFCDIKLQNNKLIGNPKQKDFECGIQIMNVIFDTGNYDIIVDINIINMNVYLKIFEKKNPIKQFKLENGNKIYSFNSPSKEKYNIKIICQNVSDINTSYFELNNFDIHHHIMNETLQTIDISESLLPPIKINQNKINKPLDNIKINMDNINNKLSSLQNNLLINNNTFNNNNNEIIQEQKQEQQKENEDNKNNDNNKLLSIQSNINKQSINTKSINEKSIQSPIINNNQNTIAYNSIKSEIKENDIDYDNYIDPKEILSIKNSNDKTQSIQSQNQSIINTTIPTKNIKFINNKKMKQLMSNRLQSKIQTQQAIDHHYIININDKIMNYSSKFPQAEIYHSTINNNDKYYILKSHLELLDNIYNTTSYNIVLISENTSLPSNNFSYNIFKQFNSFDMILLSGVFNLSNNKPVVLISKDNSIKCYPGAYLIKKSHIPIISKLLHNKLKELEYNNLTFDNYDIFSNIIVNNNNCKYYLYDGLFKSYNLINNNFNTIFNPLLSIIIFDNNEDKLINMINKILNFPTDIKNFEFVILSNNINLLQNEILKKINYCIVNYDTNNYIKNYNLGLKYCNGLYITFLYSSWNINNIFNFNKIINKDTQLIAYPFKIDNEIYNPIIKNNIINNIQVFIINRFINNDINNFNNIIKFNEMDEYPLNELLFENNLFNNIIIGEDIYECDNIICKIHNQKETKEIYNNLVEKEIKENKDVNINNISLIDKSTINYQNEISNNFINIKELKHQLTIDINNKINNYMDLSKDTLIYISSQNILENDRQFNILYSLREFLNIIYVVDSNIKSTEIDIKYNMLFMSNYIFNKINSNVFINKIIVYFTDYNKYPIIEGLIKDYVIFDVNDTIFYNNSNIMNELDNIPDKLHSSLINSNLILYSSKLFEPLIYKYCKNKSLLVNNDNINYNDIDLNNEIINIDNDKDYIKIKELKNIKNNIIIGFIGYINQFIDFSLLNKMLDDKEFRYKINIVMIGGYSNDCYNLYDNLKISINNESYNLSFNNDYNNIMWIPKKSSIIIDKFIELFDICIIPFKITQPKNNYTNPMFLYKAMQLNKPILSTINYNDDYKLNIINKDNYTNILNNVIKIINCQIEIDYNENIYKSNINDIYNTIQDQYNVYVNDDQINYSCGFVINEENDLNVYNMNYLMKVFDKFKIKYDKYYDFEKANNSFIITNLFNINQNYFDNDKNKSNNIIIYDCFEKYNELLNNENISDNILYLLLKAIIILTDNEEFISYMKYNYPNIYKKIQYINVDYIYDYKNDTKNISIIINNKNNEEVNKILNKFNKKLLLQDEKYNVNIYSKNKYEINNEFNYFDYNINEIINIKNNKVILIGEYPNGNFIYETLVKYNSIFKFNYLDVFNNGMVNYEGYIYNLCVLINLLTDTKEIDKSLICNNYFKDITKDYILNNFNMYWKNLNIARGYTQNTQTSNMINKEITHLLLTKENFDTIKVSKLHETIKFKLCILTNSPSLSYSSLIIQEIMKYINCDVYVYNSDIIDDYTNFIYNNIFDKDELIKIINDYDFVLYFNLPFDIENIVINSKIPSACFKLNTLINSNTKNYITNSYFITNYIINNTYNKIIPYNVNYNIPNIIQFNNNENINNDIIKVGCLVSYIPQNEDNVKLSYNNGLDIYLKTMSRISKYSNKNNYNLDVNIIGYNCYNKNEDIINNLCNKLLIKCNYHDSHNYNELLKLINEFNILIITDKNIDFNFNLFTCLLLNKIIIVPNTPLYIEFNKQYYNRMNEYNKNIIIYKNNDINSLKNAILNAIDLLKDNIDKECIDNKEYIDKYYNNELMISNLINAMFNFM